MPEHVPNILQALMSSVDPVPTCVVALADMLAFVGLFVALALVAFLLERAFRWLLSLVVGARTAGLVEAYMTLPGVIWHETSHALFAFVLGARITRYSLVPRAGEREGELTLGCVEFAPRGPAPLRAIQMAMSAVAPAVTGLLGLAAIALFLWPNLTEWWHYALAAYGVACLLLHSGLSRQDIRSAGAGLPLVMVLLFVFFLFVPVTLAEAAAWIGHVGMTGSAAVAAGAGAGSGGVGA